MLPIASGCTPESTCHLIYDLRLPGFESVCVLQLEDSQSRAESLQGQLGMLGREVESLEVFKKEAEQQIRETEAALEAAKYR